jgi:hypothetical protein
LPCDRPCEQDRQNPAAVCAPLSKYGVQDFLHTTLSGHGAAGPEACGRQNLATTQDALRQAARASERPGPAPPSAPSRSWGCRLR